MGMNARRASISAGGILDALTFLEQRVAHVARRRFIALAAPVANFTRRLAAENVRWDMQLDCDERIGGSTASVQAMSGLRTGRLGEERLCPWLS
jgi:hypothetical protein